MTIRAFDGRQQRQLNLLLPRAAFLQPTDDIEISGLDMDALAMTGLG
jgi:hypothetical protein